VTGPDLALLVLAKAPVPGLVKTRMCPPATPAQAAGISAAMLLDTLRAVRAVPGAQAVLALAGDLTLGVARAELAAALRGVRVVGQRGSSLGERIAAAHEDTAALLPGVPVLQLGGDTPQVAPDLLRSCWRTLRGADAVLGPATDGGWWALGLHDPALAAAIVDVPTGRPDTGERTALALRRRGCRVSMLPWLSDVDTVADALRVARTVPGSRFAAAIAPIVAAGNSTFRNRTRIEAP